MAVLEHVYFHGTEGKLSALIRDYAESGDLAKVQAEDGCKCFAFYLSAPVPGTAVLVEHWESAEALDAHHQTKMMKALLDLIKKHDIKIDAEKFEV